MSEPGTVPLVAGYDLVMLDLDGVVYVGSEAIDGAAESINAVREGGVSVAFVTNNASRTSVDVAAHLVRLGIEADPSDVVTSSQAAARVIVNRCGQGAPVAVLGAEGLREAVTAAGLRIVDLDSPDAVALVNGYGPSVVWRDIMTAAIRIRDGLWWVATNTDTTIPTPAGIAPGNGTLVELLKRFADVEPVVAGKPDPPLLEETMRRSDSARPLMIGDRLDTDIEGGQRVGVDTLLVLTGVAGLADVVAARPQERPTYICQDLRGLLRPRIDVALIGGVASAEGWQAEVLDGRLRVSGAGSVDAWWNAVASAAWAWMDATECPVDTSGVRPPPEGSVA